VYFFGFYGIPLNVLDLSKVLRLPPVLLAGAGVASELSEGTIFFPPLELAVFILA
jgi:hypothetical protein